MDNLARALLMRGARDAAVLLLKASIQRRGDDRPRLEALLSAIVARPNDRVSGPPLSLDADMVEAVAAAGRLPEARALALGADVARSVAGVEIATALEEIFEPVQDWPTGWRVRWLDALASGAVAAMTGIEREVSVADDAPAPLKGRVAIALRLLRGFSLTSTTDVRVPGSEVSLPVLSDDARARVQDRIAKSDLPGALREAHTMAFDGEPGASEVAVVLGRLVGATERALLEPAQGKLASTMPMGGAGLALLQLRMGNLADAQRLFRGLVLESPTDHASREHLADLIALDRALGAGRVVPSAKPSPAGEPPTRAPQTDWLDKRGRKANMEGWATSPKPAGSASIDWDDGNDSTSVMRADHEAELLVRAGHPERALKLYEDLVARFPNRPHFSARKAEIEAMVATRHQPLASEPTVRRDFGPAAQQLKGPATARPKDRAADPLAQTNKDAETQFDEETEVIGRPARQPPSASPAPPESRPARVSAVAPTPAAPATRAPRAPQPRGPAEVRAPEVRAPAHALQQSVAVRRIVTVV